jgi:hypothetical protein
LRAAAAKIIQVVMHMRHDACNSLIARRKTGVAKENGSVKRQCLVQIAAI